MNMKKVMAMGLAAAMTLSMAACGGSGSSSTTAAAAQIQRQQRLTMLTLFLSKQTRMRENATSAYALIRESVGDENMDKVLAAVDALEK